MLLSLSSHANSTGDCGQCSYWPKSNISKYTVQYKFIKGKILFVVFDR